MKKDFYVDKLELSMVAISNEIDPKGLSIVYICNMYVYMCIHMYTI